MSTYRRRTRPIDIKGTGNDRIFAYVVMDPNRALMLYGGLLQQQLFNDVALIALIRRRQRRAQRQYWVRPWIERRPILGNYETLMMELERESHGDFVGFVRVTPAMFYELLQRISPRITKMVTRFRRPLEPGLKLAIALRYMATGNSYHSLQYSFRVPHPPCLCLRLQTVLLLQD